MPVLLATEPTVLAIWLAAHGSGAAVADGTASTATAAPPAAMPANVAYRLRRSEVVFTALLTVRERRDGARTHAIDRLTGPPTHDPDRNGPRPSCHQRVAAPIRAAGHSAR